MTTEPNLSKRRVPLEPLHDDPQWIGLARENTPGTAAWRIKHAARLTQMPILKPFDPRDLWATAAPTDLIRLLWVALREGCRAAWRTLRAGPPL